MVDAAPRFGSEAARDCGHDRAPRLKKDKAIPVSCTRSNYFYWLFPIMSRMNKVKENRTTLDSLMTEGTDAIR